MPESLSKVELLQNEEGQDFKLCYAEIVQNLIPFQNSQEWRDSRLSIRAGIAKAAVDLHLTFELSDPYGKMSLPRPFTETGSHVPRKMGLWQSTCFELFLKEPFQDHYYEFNFSLEPAWNLFRFKAYRHPQPPEPSYDFSLRNLRWTGQRLEIELFALVPLPNFQAGITAVLKESRGEFHYVALCHKGPQADFHLPESFIFKVE